MTGKVPEWARQDMRKSSAAAPKEGVRQMPSPFHGAKVQKFADGGEVETLKQEGLKASEGEKVGFFERLRMGNIDDPKSEAYTRFGAGRGQEARMQKQEDARDSAMAEAFKNAPSQAPKAETESRDMDSSQQTSKSSGTFGSAFAAARKAGQGTFSWNGKSYTTQMKNETKKAQADTDDRDADRTRQTYTPPARVRGEPAGVRTSKNVQPRPSEGKSLPGERARWDEKFGKTHNTDGTPK